MNERHKKRETNIAFFLLSFEIIWDVSSNIEPMCRVTCTTKKQISTTTTTSVREKKNYHKCIHALKWKQSQMMNEMAEKKCTHWLFAPTFFCFDHKKTATTIYSSFVTIVFTVNLITDTQNIFFCLGLFVKSIIVYCLRMARCSRSACTHLSADWVWVTRYPKTGSEIII